MTLLAKPFGQVPGIVRARISDRFQAQALIADLAGHGFHRRQGMCHRAIHFSGGLFHLFGKGDALGAGFARRGHQADSRFHDEGVRGGGAAVRAAHIAGHDHQQGWYDQRHGPADQDQGLQFLQPVHAPDADCHRGGAQYPGKRHDKTGHNHPASPTTGKLEVFRRLLPDKQVAARRASGGHFVHSGSIPRHFARRETRMCAFLGIAR